MYEEQDALDYQRVKREEANFRKGVVTVHGNGKVTFGIPAIPGLPQGDERHRAPWEIWKNEEHGKNGRDNERYMHSDING